MTIDRNIKPLVQQADIILKPLSRTALGCPNQFLKKLWIGCVKPLNNLGNFKSFELVDANHIFELLIHYLMNKIHGTIFFKNHAAVGTSSRYTVKKVTMKRLAHKTCIFMQTSFRNAFRAYLFARVVMHGRD